MIRRLRGLGTRWSMLIAVLAMLAVACGGSATSEMTTTMAIPTTTASIAATTTSTPDPTTEPEVAGTTPPGTTTSPPAGDGASGSGCSPGPDAILPDGEWFGLVVTTSVDSFDFDLACWFSGDAAIEAAAEDGEESPPPNDYYVRNDSPTIRSVAVAPDVPVVYYPTGDPTGETTGRYEEWRGVLEGRGAFFGIWVEVVDGGAASIREQWVP